MNNLIKQKDYPYTFNPRACETCAGKCCIGESGYIWINKQEIFKLADYLKISVEELGLKYLTKIGYKYSISERKIGQDNYACIFFNLEKKQCSIYEVRPIQCRTFPFWDYFKQNIEEVKKECPGIVSI